MSWPQLQALGKLMRDEFGPDNSGGLTLDDIMAKLTERGVRVPRDVVHNELRAMGTAYESAPADKRWGPAFLWDESSMSCAGY
jgi:hypothetical protein